MMQVSMTREEAIEELERLLSHWDELENGERSFRWYSKTALEVALSTIRPVSREQLEKFKEYFDDLYGKGLEVYGWHMNGEAKSFDDFYEDACEYAGL